MPNATETPTYEFQLQRLCVVMRGHETDPAEAWGVLNPAVARTRDDELLMFPRVVAEGNLSRIAIARVEFDAAGDPTGVERLGYALEPTEWYERNPLTAGCEDPRITFVPVLDAYVMGYCCYGPRGPRAALAVSHDLQSWRRLGPVRYAPERGVDWSIYDNKDIFVFPEPVTAPDGRLSIAIVHRPTFQVGWGGGMAGEGAASITVMPEGFTEERPGIWISYCALDDIASDLSGLELVHTHTPVAFSEQEWESLKIGGGTQPVRLADGNFLSLHHGVRGHLVAGTDHQPSVHYSGGVMVHDAADPTNILYRSAEAVLAPEGADEVSGIVDNVVFPTALDDRGDGRIDVYYGMADARIGVARLDVTIAATTTP